MGRRQWLAALLGMLCLTACEPRSPSVAPETQSPAASAALTPMPKREVAGCLDLPETPAAGMTRVELWFGDATDRTALAPSLLVRRDIAVTDAIVAATLRAWTEGPTEREERAGAYPSAPKGSELRGIDVEGGTAVVDFNDAFERTGLGTTYEGAILDQLAGTITQFDTVDRALLKIDGKFKDYYMGHGFIVDEEHPIVRPSRKRYRVAPRCGD